jgi:6,7-dimethyl-8-ribityllumazine synthase
MKKYSAHLLGQGLKFAIVVSRWHDFINEKLTEGAVDSLTRHGVSEADIEIAYVPGSFEIPLIVKKMAQSGRYNAIIAIGTVIRGQTFHFDLIASQAVSGISNIMLETGVPVALGILTTDNIEQALERAGSKHGNKGSEAALAALELANLIKEF